jgi:hypothetical protein
MNSISDGQPFTYELLNKIIEELNAIKVPDTDKGEDSAVEIVGRGSNDKNKPLIIFGYHSITIPANQTGQADTIPFHGATNFDNQNPIVMATLVDPVASGTVPVGYLIITKVTNKNFDCRVKLIRKRTNSTTVGVNYVAFGYTSK